MENDQDIDDILDALSWLGCLDERFSDKMEKCYEKAMEAIDRISERINTHTTPEVIERCAIAGRIAQLEGKVVDVEIRALLGKV